jgi:ubiquinone/menaquinone biosynthesis C-methylase UbiE
MTNAKVSNQTFKEFEHEGWEAVAAGYHDHFGSLTRQTIEPMLDSLGTGSKDQGAKLLDIATGPGYVAQAARQRGYEVTAIDFSNEMVERAKMLYPGIDFQEGDAEALAFPDGSFDFLTMNFGLLHLEQPEKALAEAFRVTKPGGKFALTVWSTPDKAVAFKRVVDAVNQHGDSSVPIPVGPPFFRFSDHDEMRKSLLGVGFKTVEIQEVTMAWVLKRDEDLFYAFFTGTPRTGGLLRAQEKEKLENIKSAVAASAREYQADGVIKVPMSSVLATATA